MKKYILFSLFAVSCLFMTSCSDNSLIGSIDEKEILDPNFSYLQVYVYSADNAAQSSQSNNNSCGQSCGSSGGCSTETNNSSMPDIEVSLYSNLANMTNDIGPEMLINTNSRGIARFDNLETSSCYIYVKGPSGEKTLFIQTKKGELVLTSVGI